MSFGISTRDTLAIRSFDQAEHLFNTTKEIRGQNKFDVGVPLQYSRRDWKHKALVKINDDTYAAKLYNTNVVMWHRNGEVVVDLSYGSQSTNTFANYFLHASGFPVTVGSERRTVSTRVGNLAKPLKDRVWADHDMAWPQHEWCDFLVEGDRLTLWKNNGVLMDPLATAYKAYVDKSAAHEIRKKVAPMLEYLKIFEAFPFQSIDDVLTEYAKERGLDRLFRVHGDVKRLVAENPDDEGLWAVLAASYHSNRYDWNNGSMQPSLRFAGVDVVKKELYPMLYHNAGIYHYEPLPFGTLKDGWTRKSN